MQEIAYNLYIIQQTYKLKNIKIVYVFYNRK